MISKVYVVHEPVRLNKATGLYELYMDLKPAAEYGDLNFLLNASSNCMLASGPTIKLLKQKLFHFSDNDYIVPVGDPSLIACVCMVAGLANAGRVNFLKWDGQLRRYIKVSIDIGREI